MNLQTSIIIGVIAILAVTLIISIIKKAFKVVIFIIVIILGFSAYNIIVKKTSPLDEFKAYKTNILYIRDVTTYTNKIKTSVSNIKSIVDSNNYSKENVDKLNIEIQTLDEYRTIIRNIEHTQKLDTLHNIYISYLDTVTDTTISAQKLIMNGNMAREKASEYSNQLAEQLNKILNFKFK